MNLIIMSFFLLLSPFFAYTQQPSIKSKIEKLIRKRSPEAKVYINSASDFLEIDLSPNAPESDCQIPYMQVTFEYKYNDGLAEDKFKHKVCISCKGDENCIDFPNRGNSNLYKNNSGLCTGFISKQDAYDFIELMSLLKKQSSNR